MRMRMNYKFVTSMFLLCFAGLASTIDATRIKDITNIAGVRENQLIGYGLIVGLDGTGDRVNQTPFTQQSFLNMLLEFGIKIPTGTNLQLKNVAAVAVSSSLPPFAKSGQHLDVTVSSLGNATGLRGGELLLTPLKGADGKIYAMAQGSVIVSGFGAQGGDGSKVIVNVASSGRIPNGATVERSIEMPFVKNGAVTFELTEPDFSTAIILTKTINQAFHQKVARALDAGSVSVKMLNLHLDNEDIPRYKGDIISSKAEEDYFQENYEDHLLMTRYVPIIAKIENLEINPAEVKAKVIVNSRTGTIVVGQNVMISPVAVSHGNLSVTVAEHEFVSQPNAFSKGKTVVGTASDISINQAKSRAFVFAPGASLNELVSAINSVGAAPGDIISILEAIKASGALHADLNVI